MHWTHTALCYLNTLDNMPHLPIHSSTLGLSAFYLTSTLQWKHWRAICNSVSYPRILWRAVLRNQVPSSATAIPKCKQPAGWTKTCVFLWQCSNSGNLIGYQHRVQIAEYGFNPSTSGLWAQHAVVTFCITLYIMCILSVSLLRIWNYNPHKGRGEKYKK